MKPVRAAGFTLIELLTVIAIIAILAGLTAVVLPRALERAKVADTVTDMTAIASAMQAYYTENGTYPPGYGYQVFDQNPANVFFRHQPYMDDAGINNALKAYDRFAQDYDTNGDGILSRLEFIPLPGDLGGGNSWLQNGLAVPPYPGGDTVANPLVDPVANPDLINRAAQARPYTYVPYYKKDLERMRRIIKANDPNGLDQWDGATWIPDFMTADTVYPPPQYDGFVLIGVGPLENTRGLLVPPGGEDAWLATTYAATEPARAYYILGMRAAYLASRDSNNDGQLDFDYVARTRSGQGKAFPDMPDQRNMGLAAPMLYKAN